MNHLRLKNAGFPSLFITLRSKLIFNRFNIFSFLTLHKIRRRSIWSLFGDEDKRLLKGAYLFLYTAIWHQGLYLFNTQHPYQLKIALNIEEIR